MNILRILLLPVFFAGSVVTMNAQSGGLQLLGIGPEAVSLSLSESVTALPLGPSSMFTNPALLRYSEQAEVSVSHSFWLENSANSHASLSLPVRGGHLGFGVLTSGVTNIEARQTPGQTAGTFDVRYYAFSGSYSTRIAFVDLGVTASYLYEQLYQLTATGYGLNAGLHTSLLDQRVRVGMAALNMGRMSTLSETRTPLPALLKAGIWADAVQFSVDNNSQIPILISFTSDVHIPLDTDEQTEAFSGNHPWISAGTQVRFAELIDVRAAFRTGDSKRPFSLGMGLNIEELIFSYAFVPFETGFGSTHTVSLRYLFDW